MKKHILFFFTFTFLATCLSMAQWNWQFPIPQGNRLNDMVFIEGTSTGYTVGNYGVIMKSDNSGQSWILMDSATTVNLNGVYFTGPSAGYAVGDIGVLLALNESGQWVQQETETHYHLNAVAFASTNKGYAVGYKGQILKKFNEQWDIIPSPTIKTLYCIDFATPEIAITAGDSGTILRTTDGGNNWDFIDNPYPTTAFLDVYFSSESIGYLAGQKGLILKTIDGGISWEDISYGQVESNLLSIYFYDDTTGYSCGAKGVILSTINGGESWVYQDKDTQLSFNEVVQLYGADTICDTIVVCGDMGIILRSDSCTTHMNNVTQGGNYTISSIRFPEENKGYAVGGEPFTNMPYLLWTFDGENWGELTIDTISRYLTGMDFVDPQLAYISSTGGYVYKLMEDSAVPIKTGFPDHLYDVRAFDSATVYVAGLNGTLLKTISGDTTWKKLNTNTTEHLYSLCFLNENTGYAVGDGGALLRITNGGDQINKIPTGQTIPFYDIYFKDDNIGFIAGYSGRIFKVDRSSGQEEITQIYSGITTPLNEIDFPSSSVGYISGEGGVVLKSTDGGESWLPQYTGTQNGLRSLYLKSEDEGWIAGAGASILKTENGGGDVITPGVNENQVEKYDINLYPNPATHQTSIEFELQERSRIIISTYDLAGRQLEIVADEYRHGNVKYNYNTSNLPKGVYLLVIDIDSSRQGHKLVILK